MAVIAVIVVAVVPVIMPVIHAIGGMVRVAMECPFEQEHQEKACQHPGHRDVDLPTELQESMR
jgi:hypothetical protein